MTIMQMKRACTHPPRERRKGSGPHDTCDVIQNGKIESAVSCLLIRWTTALKSTTQNTVRNICVEQVQGRRLL